MTGSWPKLQRHSLVWLAAPPDHSPALDWWQNDRPFIVCRPRPGEDLSLGFCLPQGGRPSRHAVTARVTDLGMLASPPELRETIVRFPLLAKLMPNAPLPHPRLVGSAMWETLTGLPFTHPASDFDFLCQISPGTSWQNAIDFFLQAERVLPTRVDGELSFSGLGEISWREMMSSSPQLMLKPYDSEVRLIEREELLPWKLSPSAPGSRADRLANSAVESLLEEIDLYPKPGLVSRHDSGAHGDMDHFLMEKSARALYEPLRDISLQPGPFASCLVPMGLHAEKTMLAITNGINTHRGAIFVIGLLIAAAAHLPENSAPEAIRSNLLARYGSELAKHENSAGSVHTNGIRARKESGCGGARSEASRAFPSVFELALPRFRSLLAEGVPRQPAALETLFLLIASAEDSNLVHRGGAGGLEHARRLAADFLAQGGVRKSGWFSRAQSVHAEFIDRNLSPGGCADLLAATLFLHRIAC